MSSLRFQSPVLRRLGPPAWCLALSLLAGVSPLRATLTDLWPHFSAPTSIVTFDTHAVTASDDLLASSTLQGAYNQNALGDRLYNLTDSGAFNYDAQWLALGSSLPVTALTVPSGQSTLQALLGYQSAHHKIGGYIVYDPNCPETMNYATTLAGAFDCMVIDPGQETEAQTYGGLSLCTGGAASLQCDLTQVKWVQANAALVGDFTINHVGTPGGTNWGGTGIAGWTMDTTGTGYSLTSFPATMQYTVPQNAGGDKSVYYTPAAVVMDTDNPYEGSHAYIFSAQVYETTGAAGVKVRLDVWNGTATIRGQEVTLTANNQTLQNCIPYIPGPNPARVHVVIENCTTVAPSIRISNVACIRDRVGVQLCAFNAVNAGQLPVSKQAMVLQQPGSVSSTGVTTGYYTELRDYAVAGKMFTFMLTHSTTAFLGDPYQSTEQQNLIGNILGNTGSNHNLPGTVTPVLGYMASETNEKSDVAYLTGTGHDHFLSAASKYRNGSVWAALPQPAVSQPAPQPIKPVANGTIYVAFQMSDGDNVGFLESYRLNDYKSAYLGDVPVGFTLNPGGVFYSPQMTSYFYGNLPACSEIVAAPSGIGYVTALDAGADLTSFCALTSAYMAAEDMDTVVTWENTATRVSAFASGLSGVDHILSRTPTTLVTHASPYYVIDGSLVDYVSQGAYDNYSDAEIFAVKTAAHGVWKDNTHAWYVEALIDDHHMNPGDVLYIAQRMVATDPTYHYTFVTPTVLSLMEGGQAGGAPASSPQAVTGANITNPALYPQLSVAP